MNLPELKAAAERLLVRPGLRNDSYEELRLNAQQHNRDVYEIATWALQMLSDEPVTAEWLREKWGGRDSRMDSQPVVVFDTPIGKLVYWEELDVMESEHEPCPICETQGQFTMLALGLGLTPKEDSDG